MLKHSEIKGDLHVHSDFPIEPSHDLGHDKMDDMLRRAEELKYEYLGFSEHNPSYSKHTSDQVYSLISERNEYIDHKISNFKSVRVIKLLEIDILSNGCLAVDSRSLGLLDAAIVSVHSSFTMGKSEMTKRIINGLSHPKAKILAHPTGRLLNERDSYEVDFEKIFDFCRRHNKAIEINAWPNRLDPPDDLIQDAIRHGVRMAISTDSHATWQMDMMKYGVAIARRGWAKKSDILNTMPYNQFVKWLMT